MSKKGIFGGTFDPIHNGHLHVAYESLYKLHLDKVIFMPSGNPPHKTNKKLTDSCIRYNFIKKIIQNEEKFDISDYEINKKGLSYTYETLEFFNKMEPKTKWYFITGADCLMDICLWKNANKILELCEFVVFNRPGYSKEEIIMHKNKVEEKYNKKITFLDIPILEISSTNIRKKVKKGENISYLVPEKLEDLLTKMNLYKL
ncbi:nicotinate-nucleotide adenylyltransferase [Clostridium aestuarii]|uniref:Probable nicotinate-nucleotide adenylyltransferase n=1 Tax=Clostridium aestuarii TaxID=338193 RepID=A0ABT4CZ62_9CLOT|nr:nicotinate-nucleotide adenylyltransferase [Clostridium aestuarii]